MRVKRRNARDARPQPANLGVESLVLGMRSVRGLTAGRELTVEVLVGF